MRTYLVYSFSTLRISLLLFFFLAEGNAQSVRPSEIDSLVERTMKTFHVPGIAVALIKDGRTILVKGYGVRSLITKLPTDENTLFAIASNTKAFTAAALGILADEGKLTFDDKVIDYIPGFRLYNPYVTEEFTIRDLLTHRSGMGLGAGDLMIWPEPSLFTREDIIHNLRYLKPVSGFRTQYDYDNLLYIVAGEVVARASGMPYEDFIEKRIIQALGMSHSAACYNNLPDKSNVIDGHVPTQQGLTVVEPGKAEIANAAGGIYSSVTDLSRWVMMWLNGGYAENGKKMISDAIREELWTPQTIIPVRNPGPHNTLFGSYGLGWRISDVMGYKQVGHTGGLMGIVTQVTLIPALNLGIIVLTNQQSGDAFNAISNTIKDRYFGIRGHDRIEEYQLQAQAREADAAKVLQGVQAEIAAAGNKAQGEEAERYSGTFADPWFGKVSIYRQNNRLWFQSEKSPRLKGEMFFYKGNTFVVQWLDRTLEADAFVLFHLDQNGEAAGMTMKAISPLTDFSYDFQDLSFTRTGD
jgi:CubicO group peptidase (beta-lactamase class C family)